jgi:hypothetical protein
MLKILGGIIKGILAVIGSGLACWLFGLFNHFIWWFTNCMGNCAPFHFQSGLMKYTLPYAGVGLLLGSVGFVGMLVEMIEE